MKLLGKRINFKALKTRVKQMWVKTRIINIIDSSNDYYLVTFTHEQDHTTALTNGMWFIYDHYLTKKMVSESSSSKSYNSTCGGVGSSIRFAH